MKNINKSSNFYITNSVSEILSNTKWSTNETKLMLLMLHKLDEYRVFLKKAHQDKYKISGTDIILDSLDNSELDSLLNDIPTNFCISRTEFLSVTLVNKAHVAREIRKACDKLIDKKSTTPNPLDYNNPKSFRLLNWFSRVEYNDRDGLIYLDLNKHIIKYLVVLTQYTRIDFVYISFITNEYALKLYLHCKIQQRVYNGRVENKERVIQLTINELKELLNLGNKYQKISMLRAGVLDVAMSQINESTDMNIDYELIKSSNKYTDILITFSAKQSRKKEITVLSDNDSTDSSPTGVDIDYSKILEKELLNFGVSKNRIETILFTYTSEEIQQGINALRFEISKNNTTIKNIAGYLVKCISNTRNQQITSNDILASIHRENEEKNKQLNEQIQKWSVFEDWCLENERKINSLYLYFNGNKEQITNEDEDFLVTLRLELTNYNEFIIGKTRPITTLIVGETDGYNGKSISIQYLNKIAENLITQ
ncbi:replication initiation protein [Thiotrichales bacterium 19S11-10]|nr:replication initiation protein [Thiotrichales bacterium 19S11-10]